MLTRQHTSDEGVHWELTLPTRWTSSCSPCPPRSARTRYDERRLAKEFGDRLTVEVYRDVSDLDRMFRQFADVSATTYSAGSGSPSATGSSTAS